MLFQLNTVLWTAGCGSQVQLADAHAASARLEKQLTAAQNQVGASPHLASRPLRSSRQDGHGLGAEATWAGPLSLTAPFFFF